MGHGSSHVGDDWLDRLFFGECPKHPGGGMYNTRAYQKRYGYLREDGDCALYYTIGAVSDIHPD